MKIYFKNIILLFVLLAGTLLVWLCRGWTAGILVSLEPTSKSSKFRFREKHDTGGIEETVIEEHLSQADTQPMESQSHAKAESAAVTHIPRLPTEVGDPDPDPDPESGKFHYDTDKDRYLIYECTAKQGLCGGWGDRQRGMVSTFLLAIVTKRQFKIAMTTPCDLSACFLPNRYNWTLDAREVTGRNKSIRSEVRLDWSTLDDTLDFNEDVIFLTTNKAFHWRTLKNESYKSRVPSWAMKQWHVFQKAAWNILMKPSPVVQERVVSFLSSVGYKKRKSPLVAAHIRIGDSPNMGDFEVRYNVSKLEQLVTAQIGMTKLLNESWVISTCSAAGEVWRFLASYVDNGSQLFIATDNLEVRKMSRAKFGQAYHEAAKVILHIDQNRSSSVACLGFQDVVVDQQILTYGDVLLITQSGLSQTAAVLRGSNTSLYKFPMEGGRIRAEDIANEPMI